MNLQKEYIKTQYLYTPLFCEENIWLLLQSLSTTSPTTNAATSTMVNLKIAIDKMWVLIITNPEQKIALFNQNAAAVNQPVIWDYHVILLAEINHRYLIFDFDSRLPFVTPLQKYLQNTFIPPTQLPQEFIPYIRKVPAQSYRDKFYSDRSHMHNQIDPCQFPSWPIINTNREHSIALADYLNTEQALDDNSLMLKISSLKKLEHWLMNN